MLTTPMPAGNLPLPPPFENRCLTFLRQHARPGAPARRPSSKPANEPAEDPVRAIVCRQCLHVITSVTEKRIIHGAHIHTFANPEGIVFEIGCYRDAGGCGYIGPASSEFTWFEGYVWRIAVCGSCLAHLGWRFSGDGGNYFHGLITSRLVVGDG